jgi:hypothetical protein
MSGETKGGPSEEAFALETVTVTLCSGCIDGVGGECHTPGCALWISTAPDISIRDRVEPFVPGSGEGA